MTSYLRKAREWASPTLKTSAFLSRGVLTPEEFVRAGDELVFKCPTWSWGTVDPKYAKSYLPPQKQYLITRSVPCAMRVESMENAFVDETEVKTTNDGDDDGEGWLMSHVSAPPPPKEDTMGSLEDDFDVLDVNGELVEGNDDGNDDDASDNMDDDEDDNILQDEDVISSNLYTAHSNTDENNILQTRTYDISISYDKYYQTPRVWIFGYKEDGITPLTPDEMFEDVMSDYVKRTVTIESHPHIGTVHASIHPCQHGAVMKNIVQNMMHADLREGNDNTPTVEMYLFIFLKFVSSIIPTINYDFTMEVTADTRRAL